MSHLPPRATPLRPPRPLAQRLALLLTLATALAPLPPRTSASAPQGPPPPAAVTAAQNLVIDPAGRVVDVTFDQDVAVSAPSERFRFDIDIVQPLTRDSGAALGDLTGDGVADLLLVTFGGETLFFPGVAGQPRLFGRGQRVRHTVANASENPFFFPSANWVAAGIADFDGDGRNDVVIERTIYTNTGTPAAPLLRRDLDLTPTFALDSMPSVGDLNGDGKPDVLGNFDQLYLFFNASTPGSYSFTRQTLGTRRNVFVGGDLNGDGKTDLVSTAGIYFNTGTAAAPSFDFNSASPWAVSGGPGWAASSDQPVHLTTRDADGDGDLDLYVSNLSTTVWQALYYRNVGTAQSPSLQYVGPVTAASTPLNMFYRNYDTPNISGSRAYVADGDVDQNGLTEVLLSTDGSTVIGNPTMLWAFPLEGGPAGARTLGYQDLHTFPALSKVDHECGGSHFSPDPLCKPPDLFAAWKDVSGDGLPDVLRMETITASADKFPLFRRDRAGASLPFTLAGDAAVTASPSGAQVAGYGALFMDVNGDGRADLVTGAEDGRLRYYRNTATNGGFAPADFVPLTDAGGTPIDVGSQSWPAAIDLDGDGDLDLLVGENGGSIRKVLCVAPGSAQGYALGPLVGTPQQDPVNLNDIIGGGLLAPSLTAIDVDGDGLKDVVAGDAAGRVWLLRNTGPAAAASFSLGPLSVDRTTAAYMEVITPRKVRLRFALPVVVGQTRLAFHNVAAAAGGAGSGELTVTAGPPPAFGTLQFSAASYNVFESAGPATVTVTRTGGSDGTVTINYATSDGTAAAPGDYTPAAGTLTFNDGETSKTFNVNPVDDTAQESDETVNLTLSSPTGGGALGAQPTAVLNIFDNDSKLFRFIPSAYTVGEAAGSVTLTVTRSGDTSAAATVNYATADGTASERSDYTTALGTLRFAANESVKTFAVFVTDDAFVEAPETFSVALGSPQGGTLGSASNATVTITSDDASPPATNPIDGAQFFVRQHYVDFLNREPDAAGLAFWTGQMTNCASPPPADLTVCKVNVSAAFFVSIEFQNTGYLVYRLHQVAFSTGGTLGLRTFLPDTQEIGRGVVVGAQGWEAQLEANKQAFVTRFVARPEFATAYPSSLTPAQYVDALNSHTLDPQQPAAGGALTAAERNQLVAELTSGARSRADVLRAVAENAEFRRRQFNKGFVFMQYVGYLRRGPSDPPDSDFAGYNFWLSKLNQFGGDYIAAEMVKAFINSLEYRQRFGPP